MLRVGGEFEFHAEDFRHAEPIELATRFPHRHCLWTDTGRSALLIAASSIRHRGGKPRVWIPAFSCASVSQPFRQAGFAIQYYPVGRGLSGDDQALPQPDAGETLLFIHYFGHRNEPMCKATEAYRAAGVHMIEDCVQAGLSRNIGNHGDHAITSFRKLLPVADGAAILSREPIDAPATGLHLAPPDESFISARFMGKVMRGANAEPRDFLPLLEYAENTLLDRITPRHMSWLSQWMMARLDWIEAAKRRRANWLALSDGLLQAGLATLVNPLFMSLQDDEVPLGFPVVVAKGQRENLRAYLAQQQIYCPVHWPLDHLPDDQTFAIERGLAASMLTVPIDQRMSPLHVARVIEALAAFAAGLKAPAGK